MREKIQRLVCINESDASNLAPFPQILQRLGDILDVHVLPDL